MRHWKPGYERPSSGPQLGKRTGYGGSWTRLARRKLELCPLCERCQAAPATEVHHLIPVRLRPDLKLHPGLLKAVCRPCHELEEKAWTPTPAPKIAPK